MILGKTDNYIGINDNFSVFAYDISGESVNITFTTEQDGEPISLTVDSGELYGKVSRVLRVAGISHAYRAPQGAQTAGGANTKDPDKYGLDISDHKVRLTTDELYELHDILEDICNTRDAIRNAVGEIFVQSLLKKFESGLPLRFITEQDKRTLESGVPLACDGVFLAVSLHTHEQRSYRLSTITASDI